MIWQCRLVQTRAFIHKDIFMKLKLLSSALLGIALLAGCGGDNQTASTTTPTESATPATQANMATYVVGSQSAYPPFVLLDEKGNLIGLDIDILKAIGEKQNIHFDFVSQGSRGVTELLNALNTGEINVLATGINITDARTQHNDFSTPYITGTWTVLLDKDISGQINSFEELSGKPISVQGQSMSETQLDATKITNQTIPVNTLYLGLKELKQQKAIGLYDVDISLAPYLEDSNLYTIKDTKSGTIPVGFALKKGDSELKAKIDAGLEQIKQDGTYDKILEKWLNQSASAIASTVASAPEPSVQ